MTIAWIVIKTIANTMSPCCYLCLESPAWYMVPFPPFHLYLKPRISTRYFVTPSLEFPAAGTGGVEGFRVWRLRETV